MRKITLLFAATAICSGLTVTQLLRCRSRRSRPILRRKSSKYVGFVGPIAAGGGRITTVVTMATRTTRDATTGTVAIGSDSRGGASNSAPFVFFDTIILLPPRVRKFKLTNYATMRCTP